MVIVATADRKYKLVSVAHEGWLFYTPPIDSPENEFFISIEDPMIVQIAELLQEDPEKLPASRKAAEILLEKLINLHKLNLSNKSSRKVFIAA